MIAFWAMTYEPLDPSLDAPAEPLVMIRDLRRDGVVYLFSFSDVESAQAFLRDEVQHGTDLGSMMLYWAVSVRMAADPWGKMRLTPSLPPGTLQNVELDAPAADMWTLPARTAGSRGRPARTRRGFSDRIPGGSERLRRRGRSGERRRRHLPAHCLDGKSAEEAVHRQRRAHTRGRSVSQGLRQSARGESQVSP